MVGVSVNGVNRHEFATVLSAFLKKSVPVAVPFYDPKLRVPAGFKNILKGFACGFLQDQPNGIYAYESLYFDRLLQIRAESGCDPVEVSAKEGITCTTVMLLREWHLKRRRVQTMKLIPSKSKPSIASTVLKRPHRRCNRSERLSKFSQCSENIEPRSSVRTSDRCLCVRRSKSNMLRRQKTLCVP